MINLIPKEEKKRMTADFYYRLAFLFFVMIDFCLLIISVSIIPSYILSNVKNSAVNAKLETQKGEPLPLFDQQTLAEIKDINNKLDLVEKAEKNKFPLSSKVVDPILLEKMADVKITQILYENDPTLGRKISITGIAPSREVLQMFSLALKDSAIFKEIDLPISNFIKGSNIQFSLSLLPS